jgi:hypothetical protein
VGEAADGDLPSSPGVRGFSFFAPRRRALGDCDEKEKKIMGRPAAILPHVPNERLAALVYMNVLNTDHLRSAVPQTP